jgi:hypothetical protein
MDTQQIVEMVSQMEASRKADQAKAEADGKADREKMEDRLKEKIKTIQTKMKAHMQEIMEAQFGSLAAQLRTCRTEMMVCQQETTLASLESKEQGPKEMESEAEHREVPKEEVAEKSLRVMKMRPRGRRIAAGQCVKPTKLT